MEKFEKGWNPGQFYTPKAPIGISVHGNPTNNVVTVSWKPAAGSVTNYTVGRYDELTDSYDYFNVGLATQFTDNAVPSYNYVNMAYYYSPPYYWVVANYSAGDSDPGYGDSPYSFSQRPTGLFVAGSNASTVLIVNNIPPGTTSLRLTRIDSDGNTNLSGASMDIAVSSLSGNSATIPDSFLTQDPAQHAWDLQAVQPGEFPSSAINIPFFTTKLFYDGRVQLKQNAMFLCRAAGLSGPFSYYLGSSLVNHPSAYAYAAFNVVNSATGSGLGGTSFIAPALPFNDNYRYRNCVYSTNDIYTSGFLKTGFGRDSSENASLIIISRRACISGFIGKVTRAALRRYGGPRSRLTTPEISANGFPTIEANSAPSSLDMGFPII